MLIITTTIILILLAVILRLNNKLKKANQEAQYWCEAYVRRDSKEDVEEF
tara:strand:- start:466 stop:615 length:150 start_codon:yes stop_codon:yes gene_type:complete